MFSLAPAPRCTVIPRPQRATPRACSALVAGVGDVDTHTIVQAAVRLARGGAVYIVRVVPRDDGLFFPFKQGTQRLMPASNLCQACGIKPKYVDATGVVHSYCGKTCARSAAKGPSNSAPAGCAINGCKKPVDPLFLGFCSPDHAKLAVSSGIVPGCTRCRTLPQCNGPTCNGCANLPPDELRMWNIKQSGTVWREFEREWKDRWKSGTAATIDKLFEISYPSDVVANKEAFRQSLESGGGVRLLRTFHASQCICDMGTKGMVLCDWRSCGICNVVKSGFECVAFGAPGNKGRHGDGLYSSTDPSMADGFATSCLSSPYRVMVACDVVLPQNPSKNNSILMGDRVVVRDSGTITPRFIVMYTKGS